MCIFREILKIQTGMKTIFIAILAIVCFFSAKAQKEHIRIKINEDIELVHVKDSFYMHTSWYDFSGFGRFPSNGLLRIKNGKAIMMDTPPSSELTRQMCEFLNDSMQVKVVKVITGHYHIDCLGGLAYLHKQGVESVSCKLTQKMCRKNNLPETVIGFKRKLCFDFENEKVICRYFGGGHTEDNIVVYFPENKILFGGCLIKSFNSKNLGNTKEAVLEQWDKTILKILKKYPEIEYVIPGHGEFGNAILLRHTIELVKDYHKKTD